jgi:RNA polymerase sigma-70 factor (ECF subfamily)
VTSLTTSRRSVPRSKPGAEERETRDRRDVLALKRVVRGDETAVAEIYDRYAAVALGLAVRIVGARAEAEDVVHDAFVAIVERADQYKAERGTVASWILATSRNLAIDRARRHARQAQILELEVTHQSGPPPPAPDVETELASDRVAVQAALAELSKPQRATIEEAFFNGLSYPEIAALHGVPLGTVKSRATRALTALRGVLSSRRL